MLEGKYVPFDIGGYVQLSVPLVDGSVPNLNVQAAPEVGMGTGLIHGTFDGTSVNYNVSTPWGGGTVIFTNDQLSGVAVHGPSIGVSANVSTTYAFTLRDLFK